MLSVKGLPLQDGMGPVSPSENGKKQKELRSNRRVEIEINPN
jgi:outer membrane protein OmpA-like peptidoglycan-associated protein